MADIVIPNGAITVPLEAGKVLTVTSGAGTTGAIAIFKANRQVILKDTIGASATKTYGPYPEAYTVRMLPQTGTISYQVSASVSALPALIPAIVSPNGKAVSGEGTKPNSTVLVYNWDTGVQLGSTQSLVDGSWVLLLTTALSPTDRVGYDATVVGPFTVVGAVENPPGPVASFAPGATTANSQALTWDAPTTGDAPTGYLVEYREVGQTAYTEFPTTGTATSVVVTGLASARSYQFRVTPESTSGLGTPSAVITKATSGGSSGGGGTPNPVIGPTTAAFTIGSTAAFVTFTGLNGRTATKMTPADGRVVIATDGTALAPGLVAVPSPGVLNYTVTFSDGSTSDIAVTANAGQVTPTVRRAVTGRCQIASLAIPNPNNFTDIQATTIVHVLKDVTDISIVVGNLFRSVADASMGTLPPFTGTYGLWDTSTNTFIGQFTFGGQGSVYVKPFEVFESDIITVSKAKFTALEVKKLHRYDTPPASFPASKNVVGTGREFNEMGNGLTDRTAIASPYFTRTAGTNDPIPLLAVKGTAPGGNPIVVDNSADSIFSDNSNDVGIPMYTGMVNVGLTAAGVPQINTGISGQTNVGIVSTGAVQSANFDAVQRLRRIAGVTEVVCLLGTNDLGSSRTAAQLKTNRQTFKTRVAADGMKFVPSTLQPRTNGANTTYPGSETNTFAQRAAANADVIANNGLGDGYVPMALWMQDPDSPNLWRKDILRSASAPTLVSGGSGFVTGDELEFGIGGAVIRVVASAGVITSVSSQLRGGGYTAADFPTGAVAPTRVVRSGNYLKDGWSGATFQFTSAAVAPPNDGIHPGDPYHGWGARKLYDHYVARLAAEPAEADGASNYTRTLVGTYKGAGETDHSQTEAMLGRTTDIALDFYAQASWAEMDNSVSFINGRWQNTDKKLLLSVPLSMDGSTLAEVAAGTHDSHFALIINDLDARGMKAKVLAIRLAWEMNGGWYHYCVPADGTMADFIAAFRHVAQLFMAAGYKIHWCPNIGYGQNATPDYYPGDDVVHFVGLDVYFKRFQAIKAGAGTDDTKAWTLDMLGYGKKYVDGAQNFALIWLGEFALAHGKPIIFGEFGTGNVPSDVPSGGGDSGYFITKFMEWCVANKVYAAVVWDYPASDYWGRMSLSSSITGVVPPQQKSNIFKNTGTLGPYDEKPMAAAAMRRAMLGCPDIVPNVVLGTTAATTQALSWGAPASGVPANGYRVEYLKDGDTTWTLAASGITGTSYTVPGLTASTLYRFRVSAVNAGGRGGYGIANATTSAAGSVTTTVSVPASATAAEGSNAVVAISLDAAAPNDITVSYATSNGTATAGSDYTATSGTVTFAAGEVLKNISIPLASDAATEGPETFTFTISSPTSTGTTQLGNSSTTVTITDVASAAAGTSWLNNMTAVFDAGRNADFPTVYGLEPSWANQKNAGDGLALPVDGSGTPVNGNRPTRTASRTATGLAAVQFSPTDPATDRQSSSGVDMLVGSKDGQTSALFDAADPSVLLVCAFKPYEKAQTTFFMGASRAIDTSTSAATGGTQRIGFSRSTSGLVSFAMRFDGRATAGVVSISTGVTVADNQSAAFIVRHRNGVTSVWASVAGATPAKIINDVAQAIPAGAQLFADLQPCLGTYFIMSGANGYQMANNGAAFSGEIRMATYGSGENFLDDNVPLQILADLNAYHGAA